MKHAPDLDKDFCRRMTSGNTVPNSTSALSILVSHKRKNIIFMCYPKIW